MGIKDWFSGEKSKKKEQYRDALKEAVQDGKLSTTDVMDLKNLQRELEIADPGDDKTEQRREIYNAAVAAQKKDGAMSATGAQELAKIQKFLALRDDQVEKTKFQVTRLRTLTEIKKGNLPRVPDNSVALREVTLQDGELAHYTMAVDILDQSTTRGADGVALVPGQEYQSNEAGAHALPESGAKEMGEATLIITNLRLILKARGRLAAVKLGEDAKLFLYNDGLRLERSVGNTLLRFRSRSEESSEIVGSLLTALRRAGGAAT
jgi:hypothetical protein